MTLINVSIKIPDCAASFMTMNIFIKLERMIEYSLKNKVWEIWYKKGWKIKGEEMMGKGKNR